MKGCAMCTTLAKFCACLLYCIVFDRYVCTPIDIWNDADKSLEFAAPGNISTRDARVLNFFPVPVEEECDANDGRRKGICMNPYECRMQSGASKGTCALGFGVCCVFTATCDQDIYNNITYFVNPNFPDLNRDVDKCSVKIKKLDADVVQFKLDFVHFNLGQPNRRTGICEDDVFVMKAGNVREFTLCGINSGQHIFFDVDDIDEAIVISMNMSKKTVARLWEIRITQIPFAHRAPEGCLQYHTGQRGVLQTLNFAENGRHLANQDYNICIRQEDDMCSIAYEPCDEHSFKIGQGKPHVHADRNSTVVPVAAATAAVATDNGGDESGSVLDAEDELNANDVAGSGDGAPLDVQPRTDDEEDICANRILLPCDNEDFLMAESARNAPIGYCNLAHCGSSLCPTDGDEPCRVESDVLPFTIGVQFGESGAIGRDESPEDNIGMCLIYEQMPCAY